MVRALKLSAALAAVLCAGCPATYRIESAGNTYTHYRKLYHDQCEPVPKDAKRCHDFAVALNTAYDAVGAAGNARGNVGGALPYQIKDMNAAIAELKKYDH